MLSAFVSHGSPTILVEDIPWKGMMRDLGQRIMKEWRPESVVVISPHFISWSGTHLVEIQEKLECIQDYYGFPDELYKFCYSAKNDTELAMNIIRVGKEMGLDVEADQSWGLDHGAWIPLSFMFPGIKTVTVSITDQGPDVHFKLGQAIAKASRGKRVVLLGTGSPTHRLEGMYLKLKPRQSAFDRLLISLIEECKVREIMELPKRKEWIEAQPEGLLNPLYVALGFSSPKTCSVLGYDIPWGGVSMLAALFQGDQGNE
jgi:aromatic ring-opening dioxygenase catalytic subunit (LigB family)